MKERELREHSECSLCHRLIGHTGIPLFWTVKVCRYGVDLAAMKRQDGLAAMLGGHPGIAQAMGPDEDMANAVMEQVELTLCESCAMECDVAMTALSLAKERDEGDANDRTKTM